MYLTQGLHRALQRHPGKVALHHLGDAGERHWTFAQFADQVGRQAAALQARGIAAGDRVALLAPNNDKLVTLLMACWWLGAVACPMNTRWSLPELRFAIGDCGAGLLVADALFEAQATALADATSVASCVAACAPYA